MKVVYHNPSMSRRGQWAGERGRQFARAMERQDVAFTSMPEAATGEASGSGGRFRSWAQAHLPRSLRGPVITLRLVQRGTLNTFRWSWRLVRALRADPPDVIVARYFEYEWTPLIVSRLLRRPLILETHSPFGLENTLREGRPSRVAEWVDRRMFAAATRIWVHTNRLEQLVAELTDDPGKIQVIPFGVEDYGLVASPADPAPRVEIVFAGSFYPWHGVKELLVAYAQLMDQMQNIHLTLIGDGLTISEARDQARRLGVGDDVSFLGWMERPALFERLAQSHVGVAPYLDQKYNYFEPVKIHDFHMAGLPVVASAVGEIPDMVDDGQTGLLVPAGDTEALAAALAKLAADPGLRAAMGAVARKRARYIDDTAAAVADLSQSLVGRP